MRRGGIEELKAALRRSIWLIVLLVAVGALISYSLKQLQGPSYQAGARVLLASSDLTASLTGVQPPYVDPQRQDQAETNLARSPQLYDRAAASTLGRAGSAGELKSATTVGVSNNVVQFTATAATAARAVAIANAVAGQYSSFRADVSAKAINAAIKQIRDRIKASGASQDLRQELQRLQVLRTLNSGGTLLFDPANGATKTTPRPLRDALLGGAIGLIVALLIIGVRELLDTTVRSEADAEDALGVPVLTTVQSLPRRLRNVVLGPQGAHWADEFELLAANVAQIVGDRPPPVYLAVTSAVAGEGKTTTAVNLAVALARRNTNVVLADFDLRKPAVAEFFEIPRSAAGIHDVLAGGTSFESVAWSYPLNGSPPLEHAVGMAGGSVVKERPVRRARTLSSVAPEGSLVVLPGGRPARESSSPSFSRLPALLDRLKTQADFVVIDTPPALLAAGMAELAQRVDAVLVVVRHGVVTRRRLRALGGQAMNWRGKLIGAVLNDTPREEDYRYSYPDRRP